MKRIRKSQPTVYSVEITPESYQTILSLSLQSHRSIPELLEIAINLLNATTRNLRMMNPPPLIPKPLSPDKRAAAIDASTTRSKPLVSVGNILKHLSTNKRRPLK